MTGLEDSEVIPVLKYAFLPYVKLISLEKTQTSLNQDNANVTVARLNAMLLYMQNMLARLEIVPAAQIKGH